MPADRWFDWMLRRYPPQFRARFEVGMRDAFEQEWARVGRRGPLTRALFLGRAALEALWFGGLERRQAWITQGGSMRSLLTINWRDALRSLRATPVVTAVAVVSLALGIGANTALFSLLNGLLLKPLPVREPSQLVVIEGGSWTNPIWEEIRQRKTRLFDNAFAWSATRFNLSERGATDFVEGAWASGSVFDVLGVSAAHGRVFSDADDVPGGGLDGAVAVISDRFWRMRLGGAEDAIGRAITIDRLPVTIIGILPRGFFGPDVGRSADIMVPIADRGLTPGGDRLMHGRSTWWLDIMARLKPGQSIDQAGAALRAAQAQIREATIPPDWNAKDQDGYLKQPLKIAGAATGQSDLRQTYEAPLETLLVVVGAVLLIACANLAHLLLARAATRRRELSVRLALGASRARLVKQLLAESALLAGAGAALGLLVAKWGSALLVQQLASGSGGVTIDLSLDWRVLSFTIGVAVVTTIVFGAAPAFGVLRVSPSETLNAHGRGIASDRRFGVRHVLVVGQVALSLTLVVGSTLFLRTLTSLTRADLGFTPAPLLTANVNAADRAPSREQRLELYERLRQAAASVPGVTHASTSVLVPVGNMRWNTQIEPIPNAPEQGKNDAPWVNVVSPGWFSTFGMTVLRGRDIDDRDVAGSPRVAVINAAFARHFFGDADPIGREFRAGLEGPQINSFRVVGIVSNSVYWSLRAGPEPIVYVPLSQLDDVLTSVVVTVRATSDEPGTLTRAFSDAINRVDPNLAFTIRPIAVQLRAAVRQERLVAMLSGFFGGLALLLAALGLYGVTSHSVSRRRAEIGVRMALGASATRVMALILRRLGWLISAGVAVGLLISWWASQFVAALVFGLEPRDPLSFGLAAVVLAIIGVVAGWLPAQRASRIDPVRVLREN